MHHQLLATNWSTFFCFLHILVKKPKQRLASNKSSPVLFSFFVFFYGISELQALLWSICVFVSILDFFHVVLSIRILEIGDSPSDQSTSEGNQFELLQHHCIMFDICTFGYLHSYTRSVYLASQSGCRSMMCSQYSGNPVPGGSICPHTSHSHSPIVGTFSSLQQRCKVNKKSKSLWWG